MKHATHIAFKRVTKADFFHISKPRGHNTRGGGQSYVDLAGNSKPLEEWTAFFDQAVPYEQGQGTAWRVSLHSLGQGRPQTVKIGPRTSPNGVFRNISVREQKIHSREANRVAAWHPDSGFPALPVGVVSATDPALDILTQNLVVYILRTVEGEYWAGFFQADRPQGNWPCDPRLLPVFNEDEGFIYLTPEVHFDEADATWPFRVQALATPDTALLPRGSTMPPVELPVDTQQTRRRQAAEKDEAALADALFNGDIVDDTPATREATRRVRVRNQRAANLLRQLYGRCQITGDQFVFTKANGDPYTEVHHLIPLGKGGADSPHNLIVVSAHIHRMLHYADVEGLDLTQIREGQLQIRINGQPYVITWHPEHARLIEEAQEAEAPE